jgi:hypothetical protein
MLRLSVGGGASRCRCCSGNGGVLTYPVVPWDLLLCELSNIVQKRLKMIACVASEYPRTEWSGQVEIPEWNKIPAPCGRRQVT